jgi:hypothetical protein
MDRYQHTQPSPLPDGADGQIVSSCVEHGFAPEEKAPYRVLCGCFGAPCGTASGGDAIIATDVQGMMRFSNSSAECISGYTVVGSWSADRSAGSRMPWNSMQHER